LTILEKQYVSLWEFFFTLLFMHIHLHAHAYAHINSFLKKNDIFYEYILVNKLAIEVNFGHLSYNPKTFDFLVWWPLELLFSESKPPSYQKFSQFNWNSKSVKTVRGLLFIKIFGTKILQTNHM